MMTCRLYGREDTTHFFLPWVPLIHTVAEGCSFDWAKLLSDSLTSRITEYRTQRESGKAASFFMSAYIMDVVCFMTPFPLMSWSWTPSDAKPIHVYHSKLWEDKAADFIYEIFNWVMVSMHVIIFGNPPPRISDSIAANLSSVADWYVEAEFSYIRVFGASVPPYALPLFIPDRLVCREIARQTVIGGISKELKGFSKKVWPPFPIHLNTYSLLDFGHAKAEATALEDIKFVHIEFKKHDPHRVVSNHMASCGLKRYEHENSPHDDIFRGARSYAEVLSRIQALSPEEMADFFKFQEHRRSCLPPVLQGKNPTTPDVQQMEAKGSKDSAPDQEEHQEKKKQTGAPKQEAETPNPTSKPTSVVTPGKSSKQIDSPIISVTPLQSTKGVPDVGWIFGEELSPITVEELPPNEFFFDKKRKAIVKQELYQEAGKVAKKFKILADGKDMKKQEFATQIAGTLGAFATANQYSVESLKDQLKRKNRLIKTLEAKLATTEAAARDQANSGIEQARAADQKEIERLKTDLEQTQQVAQTNQSQISQQEELIEQLQAKLNLAESQVIDIGIFQSQAKEIRKRVSTAQQDLLAKVETIQNNCQLIDQVLENISFREKEAGAARVAFQEAVIATTKRETGSSFRFSIPEQTRGNILLKEWERNISEGRQQAKEVRKSCEETFGFVDGSSLGLDSESSTETLGQINIAKHLLNIKENEERELAEISQTTQTDIVQVDRWLIKPSVLLCSISAEDRQVERKLPQLVKDCYTFEANNQAEPSRVIAQLVEKCITCTQQAKGQSSGTK
jgi:hypothetical protein